MFDTIARWCLGEKIDNPFSMASFGKGRVARRVLELRGSGSGADGLHVLRQPVRVSQDDYLIMGCDNSCAQRNHPDVPRKEIVEWVWMNGSPDLKDGHFGNSHGLIRKDGTVEIESFLTDRPKPEYQASPEEVEWHYYRFQELKKQGMPQPERIATLKAEAALKPWKS
jgi:hypothetical protein